MKTHKIVLEFTTENDAFKNHAGHETARILGKLSEQLERANYPHFGNGFVWPVLDINGNTIGKFEISLED